MLVSRKFHKRQIEKLQSSQIENTQRHLEKIKELESEISAKSTEIWGLGIKLKAALLDKGDLEKERDKNRLLNGDNDSLRKANAKAAGELSERYSLIVELKRRNEELTNQNTDLESNVKDLKDKLDIAYKKLYPEKKVTKKRKTCKESGFIKKNKDGTVNVGNFVFIPETKPTKKKTRKVSSNGIRNTRRRQGSDS